jgi:Leucine-rich repeat (LRR) protein
MQLNAQGSYRYYQGLEGLINEKNPLEVTKINLEGAVYNNTQFSTLPKEIGKFANLLELNIDCSQLRGLNVELNKLTKLRSLSINGAVEMEALPDYLSLPNLERFTFSRGAKLKNFTALRNMTKLKSFRYISPKGSSLTAIPMELYELQSLEELSFMGNRNLQISSSICKLKNLISVNLGSGYIQLPECLGSLTKLKELYIGGADFSKKEIKALKKQYPHLKIYHQYGDQK